MVGADIRNEGLGERQRVLSPVATATTMGSDNGSRVLTASCKCQKYYEST